MYKIMYGETLVGIVTQPAYVRTLDNGYYGLCGADEAEGIAFDGAVYSLDEITLEQTYEPTVSTEYIAMRDALTEMGVLPLDDLDDEVINNE